MHLVFADFCFGADASDDGRRWCVLARFGFRALRLARALSSRFGRVGRVVVRPMIVRAGCPRRRDQLILVDIEARELAQRGPLVTHQRVRVMIHREGDAAVPGELLRHAWMHTGPRQSRDVRVTQRMEVDVAPRIITVNEEAAVLPSAMFGIVVVGLGQIRGSRRVQIRPQHHRHHVDVRHAERRCGVPLPLQVVNEFHRQIRPDGLVILAPVLAVRGFHGHDGMVQVNEVEAADRQAGDL